VEAVEAEEDSEEGRCAEGGYGSTVSTVAVG